MLVPPHGVGEGLSDWQNHLPTRPQHVADQEPYLQSPIVHSLATSFHRMASCFKRTVQSYIPALPVSPVSLAVLKAWEKRSFDRSVYIAAHDASCLPIIIG